MIDSIHLVRMRWRTLPLVQSLPAGSLRQTLDLGYLLHCRLTAIFGPDAPKPFSVRASAGALTEVLAYASVPAAVLTARVRERAGDGLDEALDWTSFGSKPLPEVFSVGRHLSFELRACPVQRKNSDGPIFKAGSEIDVFLAAVEKADKQQPLDRQAIYAEWLARQLTGARLCRNRIEHLRRVRLVRFDRSRKAASLERPDIAFAGELEVTEPAAFQAILRRGVGRHRAFGFGMLLLGPVRTD